MFKPGDLIQEINTFWTSGFQGTVLEVKEKYINDQLEWWCLIEPTEKLSKYDISIWLPAKELKLHPQQIREEIIEELLNNLNNNNNVCND
jgi:hypothetical protein